MNKSSILLAGLAFSGLLALDVFAQSSSIVPGEIKGGQIIAVAQTNFYTFTASNNDVVNVGLLRTNGSGAPYLVLYDPGMNVLFESGGNGTLIFDEGRSLLQSGTYTLAVRSTSSTFSYLLSMTKIACGVNSRELGDGPEALTPGALSGGQITYMDMDTYCFTGASNDLVNLSLVITNGSGLYPTVQVYDPDKVHVLTVPIQSGAAWAFAENWRLPKTGTYTLVVRDDAVTESFSYQLGYFVIGCGANPHDAGDGPEALTPGALSGGQITYMDMDTYCFTGASNDLVNLSLVITNGPGLHPTVQVYDPDKVHVLTVPIQNGAAWAFAENWRLPKTGTYTLVVRDDAITESFSYQLGYFVIGCGANPHDAGDGPEALTPGALSGGQITYMDMDTYCFTGASNDLVNLSLVITNGSGLYPTVQVYDPDKVHVLTVPIQSGAAWAFAENWRLPKTGTYTLVVRDDAITESFSYQLGYFVIGCGANPHDAGDGPEALTPGALSGGQITYMDMDTYCFTGASNDLVNLSLVITNGPGLYPTVQVYDPDKVHVFTVPIQNGAAWAFAENWRLPKTGTYTLVVRDDAITESFGYQLGYFVIGCGANPHDAGDGPEALTPGALSGGQITYMDMDTYCFTGASNDLVNLSLVITNGPGLYPTVQVYDPDKVHVLTVPIQSGAAWAFAENWRLPKTGTYTLVVRDDAITESFSYQLGYFVIGCGANPHDAGDGPEGLTPGALSGGQITYMDMDTYCFTGASNDLVNLSLVITNGPGLYPTVQVYDPDKMHVFTVSIQNGAAWAFAENWRLPKTGTYTLVVRDDAVTESFSYQLGYFVIGCGANPHDAGDGPEALTPGALSGGQISYMDMDAYCFTGASNDLVNLSLVITNGSGLYPTVQVYDPDKVHVLTVPIQSGAAWAFAENWRLTNSGNYTLVVRDDGLDESFGYCLNLIKAPGPNLTDPGDGPEFLAPGERRTASLVPGDLDAFAVQVIPGDRLWITLKVLSASGTSPMVSLVAPNGVVIGSATGARSAYLRSPCLWSPGIHEIFIRDDGLNEAYEYELTLQQSPVVPASSGLNQYLAIFECTNYAFARWETNAVGFSLEWCSDLNGGAGAWTPAGPPTFSITDHFYFSDPLTNGIRFFRLRHTTP